MTTHCIITQKNAVLKREFSWQFIENTVIQRFVKICSVAAELLCVDRWTDRQAYMTKLMKMPKKHGICEGELNNDPYIPDKSC